MEDLLKPRVCWKKVVLFWFLERPWSEARMRLKWRTWSRSNDASLSVEVSQHLTIIPCNASARSENTKYKSQPKHYLENRQHISEDQLLESTWVWKHKFFNWPPFKVSIDQFLPLLNGLCLVTELSLGCKIGCWWFRKKRIFRLKPNRSTLLLCYETNVCKYKPTHSPPHKQCFFLKLWTAHCLLKNTHQL